MELILLRDGGLTFLGVQVSELAENAADRTKRVAACEFLHAITLWMIGETSYPPPPSPAAIIPCIPC